MSGGVWGWHIRFFTIQAIKETQDISFMSEDLQLSVNYSKAIVANNVDETYYTQKVP